MLIAGIFGALAAAGVSWIASTFLENTPKYENLLSAVSLAVSLVSGLAAGLSAGLASPEKKPLSAFCACALTLALLAVCGLFLGGVSLTPLSALRAALTLAPSPLALIAAGAAPKRPKKRRR